MVKATWQEARNGDVKISNHRNHRGVAGSVKRTRSVSPTIRRGASALIDAHP